MRMRHLIPRFGCAREGRPILPRSAGPPARRLREAIERRGGAHDEAAARHGRRSHDHLAERVAGLCGLACSWWMARWLRLSPRLRKVLGGADGVVITVPRVGDRLGVAVQSKPVAPPPWPELHLAPGQAVPGRRQWRLIRRLELSASSDVWLAEHAKPDPCRRAGEHWRRQHLTHTP
jgi:hypothetical protein